MAPAEEVAEMFTLEATVAGEVFQVPIHATPKPTAWEDNACYSTGKNLPGLGERVKAMVYTLPHMRFNIKTGKYAWTPLPRCSSQLSLTKTNTASGVWRQIRRTLWIMKRRSRRTS